MTEHEHAQRQPLTPSNLKRYLQERGTAPFSDLVNRFDAPPEAVGAVLSFWQGRGRVRAIPLEIATACSAGCSDCGSAETDSHCTVTGDHPAQHDLYAWIDPESAPLELDALSIYRQTHR